MSKVVGFVNSSKLTERCQNRLTSLLKGQPLLDLCKLLHGFDHWPPTGRGILVVVDQGLSKGVILLPCNKTLTSEDTAKLLLENLYKWFGLLDKIISNRGPQFKELLNLLGIKSALSMAYLPQTDGTTERTNQEIEAYLSIYCASHPEEWPHPVNHR